MLGNTLEKIASEKAGIIKPGIPVVVSEKESSKHVFIQRAEELKSKVYFPFQSSKVLLITEDADKMMIDIEMNDGIEFKTLNLILQGITSVKM